MRHIRTARKWAFYIKDEKGIRTLISEKVCKIPHVTKNYKEVVKMLHCKSEIKGAGCCLSDEFHLNQPIKI